MTRNDDWDNGGDESKDGDFGPHEPPIFDVNGGKGERGQGIQVPVREEEPSTKEDPDKMSVGQVRSPGPGGDSDDGEKGRVNLGNLASTRAGRTLVAHICHRGREIKPFRGREGVSPTIVPVFFAPVFPPGCGAGGWGLVDDESCCAETDEGENGEKAENPVGEDVYTTKGLRVVAKVGEEPDGVRWDIRFRRFLLLDGILGEACPYLSGECPSRDVVYGNDKERCCCEDRG